MITQNIAVMMMVILLNSKVIRSKIPSHYTDQVIKLIDVDDPIVAKAASENLDPGWKIVTTNDKCKDSIDCHNVTKLECHTNPKRMLTLCRETCRNHFKDDKYLPDILELAGGIDDVFMDPFGFKLNICSDADGFDD